MGVTTDQREFFGLGGWWWCRVSLSLCANEEALIMVMSPLFPAFNVPILICKPPVFFKFQILIQIGWSDIQEHLQILSPQVEQHSSDSQPASLIWPLQKKQKNICNQSKINMESFIPPPLPPSVCLDSSNLVFVFLVYCFFVLFFFSYIGI